MKRLSRTMRSCILALSVAGTTACVADPPLSSDDASRRPTQTVLEYAAMCASAIRDIPSFNCLDGTIIPITVAGVEPESYTAMMTCDNPPLLPLGENGASGPQGQCIPYSRVLNFSRGVNQVVAACRQKHIRARDSQWFDEIDVIAHSTATGSTCWFQATAESTAGLDGTRVPSPGQAQPEQGFPHPATFWQPPAAVANDEPFNCGDCHDNDPFMFSPYIAQVWGEVPTDPFGWYKHIGSDFNAWQPVSLALRDNTCLGCHRIGKTFTSGRGTREAVGMIGIPFADEQARQYPSSHWMPPGNFDSVDQWQVIYGGSVQEMLSCHEDNALPGCEPTDITGLDDAGPHADK